MQIIPLEKPLGAIIDGVDLRDTPNKALIAKIKQCIQKNTNKYKLTNKQVNTHTPIETKTLNNKLT